MVPDISVVMPVYNGQKYLKEAIESILNQTFRDFEFIIIDDGSTDSSKEIIKSYKDIRIRFLEQANTGVAIALNNAIKTSQTRFIARMDADDISLPERLELQYSFLNRNPEYILVGSNAIIIDINGDFVYKSTVPVTWDEIKVKLPDPCFFHSSVMFSKNSYDKAGGYLEQISRFNCFEDSLLWNKMKDIGQMANIERPLIYYRLTPGAATAKSGKETAVMKKIYNEIILENNLSVTNLNNLARIKMNIDPVERQRVYYLHIGKKFLWNNYQPKKARANILKAIKINPFKLNSILLFMLSLVPQKMLLRIYHHNKS